MMEVIDNLHESILLKITIGAVLAIAVTVFLFFQQGGKKTKAQDSEATETVNKVVLQRNFTLRQLQAFTGSPDDSTPIYISLKGEVFDVSSGRDFYGPGGSYHMFAGKDASINLAKLSFDEADLNAMRWENLSAAEKDILEDWIMKFKYTKAYPVVGRVVTPLRDLQLSAEDLAKYNGKQEKPEGYAFAPIFVALDGKVYDVSFGGTSMYSEGKPYHLFAGKDASRALAKMSFEENDVNSRQLDDLDERQKKVLEDWIAKFDSKYPVVGTVI